MPSFRLRKSIGSADFYQIQGAKEMKEYTYYFADGTKNAIEIEEKWYDLLKEMDEAERKQKYNYERHNYPLSQVIMRAKLLPTIQPILLKKWLRK